LAPAWFGKRESVFAISALALSAALVFSAASLWKKYGDLSAAALVPVKIQFVWWVLGGALVLTLTAADFFRRRTAESALLALWVAGVFWFAAFCNWTVNGRTLLPLAPAVSILIVRRLEAANFARPRRMWVGAALSAALAWLVAQADFQKAVAVRETAREAARQLQPGDHTLWFQGHWGFQYYIAAAGARAMDFQRSSLRAGDWIAVPGGNTCIVELHTNAVARAGSLQVPGAAWLTTLNPVGGAGFYASVLGPLPFAFGRVPPETVTAYVLK
jgi:hypothetical protein